MTSQMDPFALSFDSIRVDDKAALAFAAAEPEAAPPASSQLTGESPGFYLLDDANGRFSIDRETGIVTLVHEHLLSLEAGAIHPVHIRCVEFSGAPYELKLRLRMTGRIPQIAGSEENDILAGLAAAPLQDLMTPLEKIVAPEPPPIPWTDFAAFSAGRGKSPLYGETAPFGTLLTTTSFPPVYIEDSLLALEAAPPAPSSALAEWAI